MEESLIARRFAKHFALTPAEVAKLEAIESNRISFARHKIIRSENQPADGAFVLRRGWATNYTIRTDGSRQILRLHLPGDMMAMPSIALQRETENLIALSDCTVAKFEKRELCELFAEYPRLAASMFLFAQLERLMYADRLASVASTSAKTRIAFVLLDILNRLRAVDPSVDTTFEMHLTREKMAEMTGMTAVHASRMWSELTAEELIRSDGHWLVTILDEARLVRQSGYIHHADNLDFSWLPPATPLARQIPELSDT